MIQTRGGRGNTRDDFRKPRHIKITECITFLAIAAQIPDWKYIFNNFKRKRIPRSSVANQNNHLLLFSSCSLYHWCYLAHLPSIISAFQGTHSIFLASNMLLSNSNMWCGISAQIWPKGRQYFKMHIKNGHLLITDLLLAMLLKTHQRKQTRHVILGQYCSMVWIQHKKIFYGSK